MFSAIVNSFNGKSDKNGNFPVILSVISGKCPQKRVISGTIAGNSSMEIGKTYLFEYTEGEEHPQYGKQYNFTKVSEPLKALEIIQVAKELGRPEVFGKILSREEAKAAENAVKMETAATV